MAIDQDRRRFFVNTFLRKRVENPEFADFYVITTCFFPGFTTSPGFDTCSLVFIGTNGLDFEQFYGVCLWSVFVFINVCIYEGCVWQDSMANFSFTKNCNILKVCIFPSQ
jgi:hypothetical protein